MSASEYFPGPQISQLGRSPSLPVLKLRKSPGLQSMHLVLSEVEAGSSTHTLHALVPVFEVKKPAAQLAHPDAPVDPWNLPIEQDSHSMDANVLEKCPTEQRVHTGAPTVALYSPSPHSLHATEEAALWKVPALHLKQDVEPFSLEYCPLGHIKQAGSLVSG